MKLRLPLLFLAAVLAACTAFTSQAQDISDADKNVTISDGTYTQNFYTGGDSDVLGNTSLTCIVNHLDV